MRNKLVVSVFSFFWLCSGHCAFAEGAALSLKSPAFTEGATIPKKFTGDGEDVSPPLSWSAGPSATESYAITCADPDAPNGNWWHWAIFNISPKTTSLGENVPKNPELASNVLQGNNDFRKCGYNGPAPPPGKVHHYIFKVYALDDNLKLPAKANKTAFSDAIKGHVIAEGQLTGVYRR